MDRTKREIEDIIGISTDNVVCISAKEKINIRGVLESIVEFLPPPKGDPNRPLEALIFDAWFDPYQGVVILVRIMNGRLKPHEKIRLMHSNTDHEVLKLGVFTPHGTAVKELSVGEVGFVIAGIKVLRDVKIGDTVTHATKPAPAPLAGFKEVKPMVFSGIYPTDSNDFPELKAALEKLSLNDSSFTYEPESSDALGFGFRCGFLGLLHMEIVQERLEREFNVTIVTTAPTVVYKINTTSGETLQIYNPSALPPIQHIESLEEPIAHVTIHTPEEYLGNLIKLCEERRGKADEVALSLSEESAFGV